jgi:hypothetical protein
VVGSVGRRALLITVAAAVVVAGGVAVLVRPSPSTGEEGGTCRSEVTSDVLPSWARSGFSEAQPRVTHVVGEQGRITAILFGGELHSPPLPDVNNKILWATRTGAEGPLRISATLAGSAERVDREVADGPGPSLVDLPGAGCWRLDLQWGPEPDQRDTMALVYSGS